MHTIEENQKNKADTGKTNVFSFLENEKMSVTFSLSHFLLCRFRRESFIILHFTFLHLQFTIFSFTEESFVIT